MRRAVCRGAVMWKVLSAALSKAKRIVRSNMDGNKICDDLRNNRVRAIRIKRTMPEPTIYVVLDALVRNTSCKILDLTNLRLGRHSCVALATVIRKNTHLRKLIVNGSFLENVIVSVITLAHSRSLILRFCWPLRKIRQSRNWK